MGCGFINIFLGVMVAMYGSDDLSPFRRPHHHEFLVERFRQRDNERTLTVKASATLAISSTSVTDVARLRF